MKDKLTIERRLRMLHDQTKGDSYAALKQVDEDMKGWRYSGTIPETCSTAKD